MTRYKWFILKDRKTMEARLAETLGIPEVKVWKPKKWHCFVSHIRRQFSGSVIKMFCWLEHNSLLCYLCHCGTETICVFDITIPMYFYILLLQVIYFVTFHLIISCNFKFIVSHSCVTSYFNLLMKTDGSKWKFWW